MERHLLPSFFFFVAAGIFLVIACERPLNAEAAGEEHEPPEVLALRWELAEAPLALTLEKVDAQAEAPDPAEGLLLEHRLRLQALELRCADLHLHDQRTPRREPPRRGEALNASGGCLVEGEGLSSCQSSGGRCTGARRTLYPPG